MWMKTSIDMNNNRITNLGLPTSDNDVVNRQYLKNINTNSLIHGTVASNGYFALDAVLAFGLSRIYVNDIEIQTTNSNLNMQDTLYISHTGSSHDSSYNFQHSSSSNILVVINIDRYFDNIKIIRLQKSRNISYAIVHRSLNI